jgi:hypothetical protein
MSLKRKRFDLATFTVKTICHVDMFFLLIIEFWRTHQA